MKNIYFLYTAKAITLCDIRTKIKKENFCFSGNISFNIINSTKNTINSICIEVYVYDCNNNFIGYSNISVNNLKPNIIQHCDIDLYFKTKSISYKLCIDIKNHD